MDLVERQIPHEATDESVTHFNFLKGTYFQYLAEIDGGKDKTLLEKCETALKAAVEQSAKLPSTHPVGLKAKMQLARYYHDVRPSVLFIHMHIYLFYFLFFRWPNKKIKQHNSLKTVIYFSSPLNFF